MRGSTASVHTLQRAHGQPISRPTLTMVAFDKLTMKEVDCHVAAPPDIPHWPGLAGAVRHSNQSDRAGRCREAAQRHPDTLILSLSKGEGCRVQDLGQFPNNSRI